MLFKGQLYHNTYRLYIFLSRMILQKHVTPLLKTFLDVPSHLEKLPASMRPHSGPGSNLDLISPFSPSTILLHVRPPCSSSHTPGVLPPHSLRPHRALCMEHTFPESSCPYPFGFPFQRHPSESLPSQPPWPAPQSPAPHVHLRIGYKRPRGTIKAAPTVSPCLVRCPAPQSPGHILSNLTKKHMRP